MRGGLERWKRGVESHGVRQAISYALKGTCDSHLRSTTGADALVRYSEADVTRFVVQDGVLTEGLLDESQLRRWVDGCDPDSGERRGRDLRLPNADLLLDGTINAPKSFSIAALIDEDLAAEFEALQDRLRDRIILTWQRELNARRGAGGRIRESLARVEVVELQHRRSRALDPHIHRHLWLNVKVQGADGRWSNVDSRVAMKLHTVINAEGELAARTDPRWLAALARHGYALDEFGEIAELTRAVRPLSRRSTQIEANRAVLLARWRGENPGQNPSVDVIHQIDRLAWAKDRPRKPRGMDETAWEGLVRSELAAIDPLLLRRRAPVPTAHVPLEEVSADLLAAKAVVDADARSTGCGGRFSVLDVRAGVLRAIAASGIVADRDQLSPLIDQVLQRSLDHAVDLLEREDAVPDHVKGFMASATAALKVDLAARLDALTRPGVALLGDDVACIAAEVLPVGIGLNDEQAEAVAAIGGTDRLVSITGPAGTGKTTMLRVANAALAGRGRRMVVVAPTKKAASVAGREIGATASSLHALLADHGWRWGRDAAGAESWIRLERGDPDPTRPRTLYAGPRRYPLQAEDRIVVDEAGMVDLHTATALAQVAATTGAGIAMVGDHLQATPVGHAGAMALLTDHATATVELTAVHRFRNRDYSALTLRMRRPASHNDALAVAATLHDTGHVRTVVDDVAARQAMVDAYFQHSSRNRRVALVTGTNDEAAAVNEAIQQRRLDAGHLTTQRLAVGQGEQRLLEGDVVQTRRNDHHTGVENRAVWIIRRITDTHLYLVSVNDSALTRTVDRDYVAEHVHLAYASTVHGIQGETTDVSIVGPGVDAAGLYVGMTRGRHANLALVTATTDRAAIAVLASTMLRGNPEISIDESRIAARTELSRSARAAANTKPRRDKRQRIIVGDVGGGRLGELDTSIDKLASAIRALEARTAARDARSHGRYVAKAMDAETSVRDKLVERLRIRSLQREKLIRAAVGGSEDERINGAAAQHRWVVMAQTTPSPASSEMWR